MRHSWPFFFVALFLACSPSSEAPVEVMVLVPNGETLEPQPKRLHYITDISKLEGSIAHFIGGARMDMREAPYNLPLEEYRKAVMKTEGGGVRAQFAEKDGVLWPTDFHSWAMTTAYWNLEQAYLYFHDIYPPGHSVDRLLNLPVYYWLEVLEPGETKPSTDNAFFYPAFHMMAVLPFKEMQLVPMSINLGVMAHEYAHFVFDTLVYESNPYSRVYNPDYARPNNILHSLNEGLADFHAYGVTRRLGGDGQVNFLAWTDAQEAEKRNFASATKCMSANVRNALNGSFDVFHSRGLHYDVGTLFASAFFHAAMRTEAYDDEKYETLFKLILQAYNDPNPQNPGLHQHYVNTPPLEITLESVANVFISHIYDHNTAVGDFDLQRQLCNEMIGRLQLRRYQGNVDRLPACPEDAYNGTQCPDISP